jgi:hypothetical protein
MKSALCGLLLLVAALPANAQTGSRQDAQRSRIVSLESAWNQAVMQKDTKAIDPLLDEQLIYIDDDGSIMNKAQYLSDIRSPETHYQHIMSESMQVWFFDRSAVVIGIYREQGIKKNKPYALRERFVDTWTDRNGAWVCVTSQSTLIGPAKP